MSYGRMAPLLAPEALGAGGAGVGPPSAGARRSSSSSPRDASGGGADTPAKWQERWQEILGKAMVGGGAAAPHPAGAAGPAGPKAQQQQQQQAAAVRRHHTIVLGSDFGPVGSSLGSPRPMSSPTYHDASNSSGSFAFASSNGTLGTLTAALAGCSGGLLSPAAGGGAPKSAAAAAAGVPGLFIPKSSSLYVKNLPADADKCFLYERFAPFGAIMSVKVLSDPATGACRGVGFVNFAEHDAAVRAMQALHGSKAGDKLLHVSLQAPRIRAVCM